MSPGPGDSNDRGSVAGGAASRSRTYACTSSEVIIRPPRPGALHLMQSTFQIRAPVGRVAGPAWGSSLFFVAGPPSLLETRRIDRLLRRRARTAH